MIQFDCHAHVYETVRAVSGARYVPDHPAPLSEWLGHQATRGLGGGGILDVDDQRIELWSLLGREYAGHGFTVGGVCAQAIHGFSRKGDQTTFAKLLRRRGNGNAVGRDDRGAVLGQVAVLSSTPGGVTGGIPPTIMYPVSLWRPLGH